MLKFKLSMLIVFLGLLFLAGCHEPSKEAAQIEKVKIGVMLPLTGDAAAYGLPLERSVRIAVEEINAAGGIKGKPIELIVEDSKCNPKDGASAAKKLVEVDKVKFIIGGACSGETLGAAPITEGAKVILFSPSATSPDITNAGDFVFRTAPSDAFAGKIAAETAYEIGARRAAILNENTDYPQGLRRVFKARFEELGGEIVAAESFNPEETDFRTQILKIKEANPDAIYVVPQAPPKGVLAMKQLREAGIEVQVYTAEVLIGRDVAKENAADLEGIIGFEQAFDPKGNRASSFLSKYSSKYGEPPFPAFMSGAYDIVHILSEGISSFGEDTERIRDWLYTLKDYEGAIGKLTLDKNGDPVLEFSKKQVRNGEVVELKE